MYTLPITDSPNMTLGKCEKETAPSGNAAPCQSKRLSKQRPRLGFSTHLLPWLTALL